MYFVEAMGAFGGHAVRDWMMSTKPQHAQTVDSTWISEGDVVVTMIAMIEFLVYLAVST